MAKVFYTNSAWSDFNEGSTVHFDLVSEATVKTGGTDWVDVYSDSNITISIKTNRSEDFTVYPGYINAYIGSSGRLRITKNCAGVITKCFVHYTQNGSTKTASGSIYSGGSRVSLPSTAVSYSKSYQTGGTYAEGDTYTLTLSNTLNVDSVECSLQAVTSGARAVISDIGIVVEVPQYTVTYTVDGETFTTQDYAAGDTISAPNAPSKEGYSFDGWSGLPATMPAQNLTVSAVYTARTLDSNHLVDDISELPVFREKLYNEVTGDIRPGNVLQVQVSTTSERFADEGGTMHDVFPVSVIGPGGTVIRTDYYVLKAPVPDQIVLKSGNQYFLLDYFDNRREDGVMYTVGEEVEAPEKYYTLSASDVVYGNALGVIYEMLSPSDSSTMTTLAGNRLSVASSAYQRKQAIANHKTVFTHTYTFTSGQCISTWSVDTDKNEYEENNIFQIILKSGQNTVSVTESNAFYIYTWLPAGVDLTWSDFLTAYKASGLDPQSGKNITGVYTSLKKMPAENLTVEVDYDTPLSDNFIYITYISEAEIYSVYPAVPGDTDVPVPADRPKKKGYHFTGWTPAMSVVPQQDAIRTATFEEGDDEDEDEPIDPSTNPSRPTYTATYYLDNVEYKVQTLYENDEFEVLPDVVRTGYVFSGWEMKYPENSQIPGYMPDYDIELHATMTARQPNLHLLRYVLDGNTFKQYQVDYGWPLVEDPIVIRQGKIFSGWQWPSPGKPLTMPEANITVTGTLSDDPNWELDLPDDEKLKNHTLTYYNALSLFGTQTYAYGADVSPLAPPQSPGSGYIWTGWTGIPSKMPAHDVTCVGRYISDSSYPDVSIPDGWSPSGKDNPDDPSWTPDGSAYKASYVVKSNVDNTQQIVRTDDVSSGQYVHINVDISNFLTDVTYADAWYLDGKKCDDDTFRMPNRNVNVYAYIKSQGDDEIPEGYHAVRWMIRYAETEEWFLWKQNIAKPGDPFPEPEIPRAPAYLKLAFDHWDQYPTVMPDEDVTVYGYFRAGSGTGVYKVKYFLRTHETSYDPTDEFYEEEEVTAGSTYTLKPLIETPEGKKLDGWYYYSWDLIYDGGSRINARRYETTFIMPAQDVNVYCDVWYMEDDVNIPNYGRINCYVRWTTENGYTLYESVFCRYGDEYEDLLPEKPTWERGGRWDENWVCSDWHMKDPTDEMPDVMPRSDLDLYAEFTWQSTLRKITYYYKNEGEAGANNPWVKFAEDTCLDGSTYTFRTTYPDISTGYIFDGWLISRSNLYDVFSSDIAPTDFAKNHYGYYYTLDLPTMLTPRQDVEVIGTIMPADGWIVPAGYHRLIFMVQKPNESFYSQYQQTIVREGDTLSSHIISVPANQTMGDPRYFTQSWHCTAWHMEVDTDSIPQTMPSSDLTLYAEYVYSAVDRTITYKYRTWGRETERWTTYAVDHCYDGSTYTFRSDKPTVPEGKIFDGWLIEKKSLYTYFYHIPDYLAHMGDAQGHYGYIYISGEDTLEVPQKNIEVIGYIAEDDGFIKPQGYYTLTCLVMRPNQNYYTQYQNKLVSAGADLSTNLPARPTYTQPSGALWTETWECSDWHGENGESLPSVMPSNDLRVYAEFDYVSTSRTITYKYKVAGDLSNNWTTFRTETCADGSWYTFIDDIPTVPEGKIFDGWLVRASDMYDSFIADRMTGYAPNHYGYYYVTSADRVQVPKHNFEVIGYIADDDGSAVANYKTLSYMVAEPGDNNYNLWNKKSVLPGTDLTSYYQLKPADKRTGRGTEVFPYRDWSVNEWHFQDGSALPTHMPNENLVLYAEYIELPVYYNIIYKYNTEYSPDSYTTVFVDQCIPGQSYTFRTDYPSSINGYIFDGWYARVSDWVDNPTAIVTEGRYYNCFLTARHPSMTMPYRNNIEVFGIFVREDGGDEVYGYRKITWQTYVEGIGETGEQKFYKETLCRPGSNIVEIAYPANYSRGSLNYTFRGWDEHVSVMPDYNITISGAFVKTGQMFEVTYKIVTVPESGNRIYEYYTKQYEYMQPFVVDPRPPVKEGYYWSGWDGVPNTMPNHTVIITGYYYPGVDPDAQHIVHYENCLVKYMDSDDTTILWQYTGTVGSRLRFPDMGSLKPGYGVTWLNMPEDLLVPDMETIAFFGNYSRSPMAIWYRYTQEYLPDSTPYSSYYIWDTKYYNIGDTCSVNDCRSGIFDGMHGMRFSEWVDENGNSIISDYQVGENFLQKFYGSFVKVYTIKFYDENNRWIDSVQYLEGEYINYIPAYQPSLQSHQVFKGWSDIPSNRLMPNHDIESHVIIDNGVKIEYILQIEEATDPV